MPELNRENIIKALECCVTVEFGGDCPFECPYAYNDDCENLIFSNALTLIKQLTEEKREIFEELATIFKKHEKSYNYEICELLFEDLGTGIAELQKKHIGKTE